MKEIFRQWYWKYPIIMYFIAFLLRIKNIRSRTKFHRRAYLSPFDYKDLSKNIPVYPFDKVMDNNYYGISYNLKEYCNKPLRMNAYIEHGLFLGSLVKKEEIYSFLPTLVTFSKLRERWIKMQTSKKVVPIGPYIHYSNDYYSEEEFNRVKKKIGKTLLVFPSHSIIGIEASFDIDHLIERIGNISKNYNTTIICLYYQDVLNGMAKYYEDVGFIVVCAGHLGDSKFLSRLKSIIKLADYTISNNIGTHVGYCVYLGKKHYVLKQEISQKSHNKDIMSKEINQRNQSDIETLKQEKAELLEVFGNTESTFEEQYEIALTYWGFDSIKNPYELNSILAC